MARRNAVVGSGSTSVIPMPSKPPWRIVPRLSETWPVPPATSESDQVSAAVRLCRICRVSALGAFALS